MTKQADWIEKRQSLRVEAEALVSRVSSPTATAVQPAEVLVHELLVHKIELEMQVDELQKAYASMEAAHDRYADLYDSAPVGFMTISRQGLIAEINLAGATLFNIDRCRLIGSHFSTHLSQGDADRWHRLLQNIMERANVERHTFALELKGANATALPVVLECQRAEPVDAPPVVRCALIDLGRIGQSDLAGFVAASGIGSH